MADKTKATERLAEGVITFLKVVGILILILVGIAVLFGILLGH